MSTEYCVKCAECNALCDGQWEKAYRIPLLKEYIRLWPHIKPIVTSDYGLGISDEYQQTIDIGAFMVRHDGHTLIIHDEYGRDTPLEDTRDG